MVDRAHMGKRLRNLDEFDRAVRERRLLGIFDDSTGELSIGSDFDGLLSWGLVDNQPFLRCMHGFCLCLWRLGRFEEAERVVDRMLWLNPSDNQGAL